MGSFLVIMIGGLAAAFGSAFAFYRWGWWTCAPLAVIALAILFFQGFSIDKITLLSPFIVGLTGGYVFRKGKSLTYYILIASFAVAIISSFQFYYQREIAHVDTLAVLKVEFERVVKESEAPEDVKTTVISDFNGWVDGIGRGILPFLFFLNGLLFSAVVFMFLKMMIRLKAGDRVRGLEYFKLVDYAIFALIAGWAVVLLVDKSGYGVIFLIGLNLALAASVLYFIQALGVIKFLLLKKGLPGYLLPLSILILFISGVLVFGFIFVVFVGLGALDFWADFRKLGNKTT